MTHQVGTPENAGYPDFAVGVCGFPRSGSSMTMRILDAGGIKPVAGVSPGSYELRTLDEVNALDRSLVVGHSVKLLEMVQWLPLRTDVDWQFIWNDRDPREQARSQIKFASHFVPHIDLKPDAERIFSRSYRNDRAAVLARYRRIGPVLVLSYERTLEDPVAAVVEIAHFLGRPFEFDVTAAVEVVQRRSPACAPDLAFELQETRS